MKYKKLLELFIGCHKKYLFPIETGSLYGKTYTPKNAFGLDDFKEEFPQLKQKTYEDFEKLVGHYNEKKADKLYKVLLRMTNVTDNLGEEVDLTEESYVVMKYCEFMYGIANMKKIANDYNKKSREKKAAFKKRKKKKQ
jgi:hypothetical protein